ncbi:MAG: Alpha-L-fucosidase [Lentisphaerae bacterium ADurb.BinA184]|nr:MAG: Alpha-L-fucosidase [Lentisphaerae bacterium ADurb.BinA184]
MAPNMDWFVNARYGLMMHYGLYSILGRGEWVRNREQIPAAQYARLARRFNPAGFDAEAICDLAVRAGMRYVCFTTMHHDGFRLYGTGLSDFNSVKASGRDLVRELVEAARRRGLRISLYHSLNNWHDQPDAVAALEDRAACETFIRGVFERVRELVTLFNPIDCLWYDGWWPFTAEGWRGEEMNAMVRAIQPHILFNGRNGLAGDFGTPEQHMGAPSPWRPWEGCITANGSWSWHRGDRDWKTPWQVAELLACAASQGGNLLLNVGPKPDGSLPPQAPRLLEQVGSWLKVNGEAIYDTDLFTFSLRERGDHRGDWAPAGPLTTRGNNLYLLARRWPGSTLTMAGFESQVRRVTLLATGADCAFVQRNGRVAVKGLPAATPDRAVCPVVRFECDAPPRLYLTGGMRVPTAPHPHYDPCPSDLAHA